jgi:hypothetical protein
MRCAWQGGEPSSRGLTQPVDALRIQRLDYPPIAPALTIALGAATPLLTRQYQG